MQQISKWQYDKNIPRQHPDNAETSRLIIPWIPISLCEL